MNNKISNAKKMLIYVPGFLSESGSQLTPALRKWCIKNNRQLALMRWDSFVMEDVISGCGNSILDESYAVWRKANKNAEKQSEKLCAFVHKAKMPLKIVGFSLGCKLVSFALQKINPEKVEQVILFGAAMPSDWDFDESWRDKIVNFHSENDWVLKFFYKNAEQCDAGGCIGFPINKVKMNIMHPFGHLEYRKVIEQIQD